MFQKTLVLINPHAQSGKALQVWDRLSLPFKRAFGEEDVMVGVTAQPQDIRAHVEKARESGRVRVIAVGGDGTNHHVVNELLQMEFEPDSLAFGHLSLGTGQDFARTLGIPRQSEQAIQWLAEAKAVPMDIGQVDYDGKRRYFINSASVGISGEIVRRVNATAKRRVWTFWLATMQTILRYRPPQVRVSVDGQEWYAGKTWIVAVANGRFFGRGMQVAPHAKLDDGRFDVLLTHDISRLTALLAFNSIYSGTHLKRDDVQFQQSGQVDIQSTGLPLPFELDGESDESEHLVFRSLPGALRVLRH